MDATLDANPLRIHKHRPSQAKREKEEKKGEEESPIFYSVAPE